MTDTINAIDAAKVVMENEDIALQNTYDALVAFDAQLSEILATLPASPALDAARIINELRSSYAYRLSNEMPILLGTYQAPTAPGTMSAAYSPPVPMLPLEGIIDGE